MKKSRSDNYEVQRRSLGKNIFLIPHPLLLSCPIFLPKNPVILSKFQSGVFNLSASSELQGHFSKIRNS